MTKVKETGAAPVSKYAAKKQANAIIEANENNESSTVAKEQENDSNNRSPKTSFKKKVSISPAANNYPKHMVEIALIIKNNAEIRRFTALGILNYLLQKGEIKGEKRYVSFKWNKFSVKCDGLMREYSYNEPFFLNALVASFASFSASAQRTIDTFCRKEMSVGINKAILQEDVDEIVALNEKYQSSDIEDSVEQTDN